jgi:hypothetical protein
MLPTGSTGAFGGVSEGLCDIHPKGNIGFLRGTPTMPQVLFNEIRQDQQKKVLKQSEIRAYLPTILPLFNDFWLNLPNEKGDCLADRS